MGNWSLLILWIITYLGSCGADELCQTGRYDKKQCKYGCCSAGEYSECCGHVDGGLVAGVVLAGVAAIAVGVVVAVVVKKQLNKTKNPSYDGVMLNTAWSDDSQTAPPSNPATSSVIIETVNPVYCLKQEPDLPGTTLASELPPAAVKNLPYSY